MKPNEIIKKLREDRNITQKEISDKLNINISVYNKIELGIRPIRDNELIKFSNFFNVSTDYLLGKLNNKTETKTEINLENSIEKILNELEQENVKLYGEKISEEEKKLISNALLIGLELSKKQKKK